MQPRKINLIRSPQPNASVMRWPVGPLVMFIAGIVGLVLGLYAYFAPLTGVTGTPGAMLVIGSSAALVIDAVILWRAQAALVFWLFWILGVVGALGTISAAFFLHTWWLLGTTAILLVGLIVTLASRCPSYGAEA